MGAHPAQLMPFNAKVEGIRADSEDKERIFLEVLAEVRSAFYCRCHNKCGFR
jgi:hypothetical protein